MICIQTEDIGTIFTMKLELTLNPLLERNTAGKTLKREIRKHLAKEWEKKNKGNAKAKL